MILTEKDAATKLCPFIRKPEIKADDAGSMIAVYEHVHCRGSRCMGWRWWDGSQVKERHGFCGMAGGMPPGGQQ